MAITAAQVKELREKTGAGMMDCKKALTECEGDIAKAVDWLREKGIAKSAKKEHPNNSACSIAALLVWRIQQIAEKHRLRIQVRSGKKLLRKRPVQPCCYFAQ